MNDKIKEGLRVSGFAAVMAFISIFAVSCKHSNQYVKQTATLDSLGRALGSTDSLLNTVDSVKIRKCVNHVIITMDYVKIYNKDSISPAATEILKNFSNTRWQLQIFLGRAPYLKKEIKKSMTQVAHLNHDFKNGLIPKDSAMTYYNYESKKARELVETAQYGMDIVKMQLPINELISPQADSLVNRLKNHQKI